MPNFPYNSQHIYSDIISLLLLATRQHIQNLTNAQYCLNSCNKTKKYSKVDTFFITNLIALDTNSSQAKRKSRYQAIYIHITLRLADKGAGQFLIELVCLRH